MKVHLLCAFFISVMTCANVFAQDVKVKVIDGVVHLDGTVQNESDIVAVEEAVKGENEDLKIVNSLKVSNKKSINLNTYEEDVREDGDSRTVSENERLGSELGNKVRLAIQQNLSGSTIDVRRLDEERMVVEGSVKSESEKEEVLQKLANKNDIIIDKLQIGNGKSLNEEADFTLWIMVIGFIILLLIVAAYIYACNKDQKEMDILTSSSNT